MPDVLACLIGAGYFFVKVFDFTVPLADGFEGVGVDFSGAALDKDVLCEWTFAGLRSVTLTQEFCVVLSILAEFIVQNQWWCPVSRSKIVVCLKNVDLEL